LIGAIHNPNKSLLGNSNHNPTNIDIYVLPNYPWSYRAIKLLDSFYIKYNCYLITNHEDFNKISSKTSTYIFPQIFINNQFIGRFPEVSNLTVK
tara:strand:- start:34 stop:315 length:282 start_codon:yes stop_codon:yes gene_type:complete